MINMQMEYIKKSVHLKVKDYTINEWSFLVVEELDGR